MLNKTIGFYILKCTLKCKKINIKKQLACILQLCDGNSGYGALQCNNAYSCPGSYNGNCNPNYVWSGSMVDSSQYYRGFGLESGTFANFANSCGSGMYGKCITTWAFGVRCVLDVNKQKF